MKQLQNNYTTPEQSKRLLELGVPADSADCYYETSRLKTIRWGACQYGNKIPDIVESYVYPCWSVGRLIEIYEICTPYKIEQFDFTGTYIEQVCKAFLFAKEMKCLDFSKLED